MLYLFMDTGFLFGQRSSHDYGVGAVYSSAGQHELGALLSQPMLAAQAQEVQMGKSGKSGTQTQRNKPSLAAVMGMEQRNRQRIAGIRVFQKAPLTSVLFLVWSCCCRSAILQNPEKLLPRAASHGNGAFMMACALWLQSHTALKSHEGELLWEAPSQHAPFGNASTASASPLLLFYLYSLLS